MITYVKGDLFSSPAQVLVNTVNTVGVMGKGVALQFKESYPEMFHYYQQACDEQKLKIGNLLLWKSDRKWILLFPTKQHWRNPSKLEYIEAGLQKFVQYYYRMGIESIAFPKLGCGNGKLNWKDVKAVMEKYLSDLPIQIYIYVDKYIDSVAEHEQIDVMNKWLHSTVTEIGFNMLKEDLQKQILVNPELVFQNGMVAKVEWKEDKIYIINGRQHVIEEKDLCLLWNFMRESGVFRADSIPEQYCEYREEILLLFRKLEYLQPVFISDDGDKFTDKTNGYQYLER